MKKFLLDSSAFFVVVLLTFIGFWVLICFNRDKTMRMPNDCNIVFLGNSLIESAINDSIVKNSFNFAKSAERMEFVYSKLKLLNRYNSNLDTVVIGLDSYILSNPSCDFSDIMMISPYYYDTYNLIDFREIIKEGSHKYFITYFERPFYWRKLFDSLFSYLNPNFNASKMIHLGGYLYLKRDKLKEAISRQKLAKKSHFKKDKLSIYFFEKIMNYCEENNITVIFIHPPMHNQINKETKFYKQYYLENYSHIKLYDFRELHLPDSCFGDLDHLNFKGAKVFSEFLEKEVLHKHNYLQ